MAPSVGMTTAARVLDFSDTSLYNTLQTMRFRVAPPGRSAGIAGGGTAATRTGKNWIATHTVNIRIARTGGFLFIIPSKVGIRC